MAHYRRSIVPDGTFFFTVNLANRQSTLLTNHINILRAAYAKAARELPFKTVAVCVVPDHLHTAWILPTDGGDFSTRWQRIKASFSHHFPSQKERGQSKRRHREKSIWQRRF